MRTMENIFFNLVIILLLLSLFICIYLFIIYRRGVKECLDNKIIINCLHNQIDNLDTLNDELEANIAKYDSLIRLKEQDIEELRFNYNVDYEEKLSALNACIKHNKSLKKRLSVISSDYGKRTVVGSLYNIGDIIYFRMKDKVISRKITKITFIDFGSEYDVIYTVNYYGRVVEVFEGDCFRDKDAAMFWL